jgi:hypothetical protein
MALDEEEAQENEAGADTPECAPAACASAAAS